jgi:hypothetical protein
MAGTLKNLESSLGRNLAKLAFRTETAFEKGVFPAGQIFLLAARTAASDLRSPPADEEPW